MSRLPLFRALSGELLLATFVAGEVPPRVLKTVPANGSEEVDPATSRIRIEFDQPMSPASRS
jgi:hypothetical protein